MTIKSSKLKRIRTSESLKIYCNSSLVCSPDTEAEISSPILPNANNLLNANLGLGFIHCVDMVQKNSAFE